MNECSDKAKNRVEKTKKIKLKLSEKVQKTTAQDKVNINYSLSPQELIKNHFLIMDMKCKIKSNVIFFNLVVTV